MPQNYNELTTESPTITLRGPRQDFFPAGGVSPSERTGTALSLFQSFLCNSPEERSNLSNVILLWEQIPRFSGDRLNRKKKLSNEMVIDFEVNGHPFQLSMLPGTHHETKNGKRVAVRRYPGIREQAVEQALIQVAADQALCSLEDGKAHYYVYFSIRQLQHRLRAVGSTQSSSQIRAALEVLNSSVMGLTMLSDNGKPITERTPIIPLFRRRHSDEDQIAGTDEWVVRLHPIVSHAIRNVTYRQFPISETAGYRPFGAHLVRRIFFAAPNISPSHPYKFSLMELSRETPGLDHTRYSYQMKALEGELQKMKADALITHYDVAVQYANAGSRGRPSPCDAEITLYPGEKWVKNVKSASKRQTLSEQSLGLPRSQRTMRQQTLPLC